MYIRSEIWDVLFTNNIDNLPITRISTIETAAVRIAAKTAAVRVATEMVMMTETAAVRIPT